MTRRLTDEQAAGIRAVLADALLRIAAKKRTRNENDGPVSEPAAVDHAPEPPKARSDRRA